ncbi:MAG: S-layer homology domain-containing protein, partial [Clostridiales bacterium]|nr:S-layer homology domain-containing protein [Clostridiales bacterium]
NITRAEFITMLTGIYNIEMPAETAEEEKRAFADTTETDWYYPGVMAAAYAGIMSGDGGMAYPNREITRQEMAVLICKAMEYKGFDINSDTELSRFKDDDAIDRWAFASVKKLQTGGVISGNDGYFAPKDNAKRCEAAQMLYKAMNVAERSVSENEIAE